MPIRGFYGGAFLDHTDQLSDVVQGNVVEFHTGAAEQDFNFEAHGHEVEEFAHAGLV